MAGVLLITAIVYWPTMTLGYVWDDQELFFENDALRLGWSSLANIGMPVLPNTTYFRPLVLASFVAEFAAFGASATISHIANLCVHMVNTTLVFGIATVALRFANAAPDAPERDDGRGGVIAAFAALTYSLHPALVESVAWVAGRFDLLCATFTLTAISVATSREATRPRMAFVAISTFAALLCKEMAITIPCLILTIRLSLRAEDAGDVGKRLRRSIHFAAASMLGVLAYLLLRIALIPGFIHTPHDLVDKVGWLSLPHAVLVAQALLFYVRLAVLPLGNLVPVHPLGQSLLGGMSAVNVASVVATGCIVLLVAVGLARIARKPDPITGFAVAFFVALLPVLQLIPLTISGGIGENRFLTLPLAFASISLCLSLRLLLVRVTPTTNRFVPGAVGAAAFLVLVLAGWATRITLPIWASDVTLFRASFAAQPQHLLFGIRYLAAANTEFGSRKEHRVDLEAALAQFLKIRSLAVSMPPQIAPLLATTLTNLGEYQAAHFYLDGALGQIESNSILKLPLLVSQAEVLQAQLKVADAQAVLVEAKALALRFGKPRDFAPLLYVEARQAVVEHDERAKDDLLSRLEKVSTPTQMIRFRRLLEDFRISLLP